MSLMFCNGPDEALVALVVKQFQEQISGFLGRTAIQKLCYFSRELRVPFSYRFSIYHYGPYSDDLASALDYMVADHVLVDTSPDRQRYSNFRLGPNASELLTRYRDAVKEWEETIVAVATAFGDLRPETLELMATVHFAHQRLKASGRTPTKENVVDEFRGEKGDKFNIEEIQRAYRALKEARVLE